MTRFAAHTPESAPRHSRKPLAEIIDRHGDASPMVRTMAGSPSVLNGYLDLSRAMKRAKLDRAAAERISLAVQHDLECDYCLAAHADAARSVGVSEDEIARARAGWSEDPRLSALVAFGRRVGDSPASVTDEDVEELLAAGYSPHEILDVVGIVALNILTGAFNLVAGLHPQAGAERPPEPLFQVDAPVA